MQTFKIFDTHAHYDDDAFSEDYLEIFQKFPEMGIGRVVDVASNWESIPKVSALADQYEYVYGALGIHPSDCGDMTEEWLTQIREKVVSDPKIVAIGEIGLDYYWPEPDHEIQKHWFRRQIECAKEIGYPIIIHSREAAQDTLQIMQEMGCENMGGVVHCYSYSLEMAREFIKMGFYIGMGGVVTFKNARRVKEVVAGIPLERIVLETDCPYMAPTPYRGERNSSLYLPLIVEQIAALQNTTAKEVIRQTEQNAERLYRLK